MSDPSRNKFGHGPFLRFDPPRSPFRFDLPQDPFLSRDLVRDLSRLEPRVRALQSKAARDLTQEEASDLVAYYGLTGEINLEKPVTFQLNGKPAFPKPNEKVTLGLAIAGVAFIADNKDPKVQKLTRTGPLDMRTVVLVVRLSQYLYDSKWRVRIIYWGGLGYGRSSQDRHGQGFALDFHGAMTSRGRFDVLSDWGNRVITLPNGTPAPGNTWPFNMQPHFRLDVDDPTGAAEFFYNVYHFFTRQAVDGPNATHPSSIGDRSQILHPDHPDPGQRPSHQNHIHAEINK
jgi:hypothetical protein